MTNKKEKPMKWVIMIYACANDKNSEEGMTRFFDELDEVGKGIDDKGDKAEMKILLHAYRDWGTRKKHAYYARRFEIKTNFLKTGKDPKDVVYTNLYTNMGDPNALSDFIVWCKNKYKAEHYLLLLWGHGAQYGMFTGSLASKIRIPVKPKNYTMTVNGKAVQTINQIKPVNKTIAEQYNEYQQVTVKFNKKNKKGLYETDTIERKIINTGTGPIGKNKHTIPPTVIYYFDVEKNDRLKKFTQLIPQQTINDSLTIEEICKSLWDTGHYIKSPGKIDIVMIFGCAMQTFELAYELSKCGSLGVNYLIASEELIYWEGYYYKKSFLELLKNPNMNSEELCKNIIADTIVKPARKNNRGDGHKDKPAWAVSCVNIKKAGYAAKLIDNISHKLLDISLLRTYKSYVNKRNIIKVNLSWEYWKTLLNARVYCHHFGEAAFYDCYIDLIWFYKSLKKRFEKDLFINRSEGRILKRDSPSVFNRYKKICKELKTTIQYLDKKFIVARFIGPRRSEKAIWEKTILNTRIKEKIIKSSTGAHGVNIFFPISKLTNKTYRDEKYFLTSRKTDYNLEFETNIKKISNWHSMLNLYISRNHKTTSQLIKDDIYLNIGDDAEPTNKLDFLNDQI